MKERSIILAVMVGISGSNFAQTQIDKTIPVQSGQTITMRFDYPELVKLSTWDKNEISVQGVVSINGGENDDAFVMDHVVSGNVISIKSEIRDMKGLPQRVTIDHDGQRIIFKDKAEFKKYQQAHGQPYNYVSQGPDIEIVLDIKVPKNIITRVESVYGMVEVKSFTGPLTVDATYGGVDAALSERAVGEIVAETNFGNIFTNFDTKFGSEGIEQGDFHTQVLAKPGNGPKYDFESKYGNVYIRKSLN